MQRERERISERDSPAVHKNRGKYLKNWVSKLITARFYSQYRWYVISVTLWIISSLRKHSWWEDSRSVNRSSLVRSVKSLSDGFLVHLSVGFLFVDFPSSVQYRFKNCFIGLTVKNTILLGIYVGKHIRCTYKTVCFLSVSLCFYISVFLSGCSVAGMFVSLPGTCSVCVCVFEGCGLQPQDFTGVVGRLIEFLKR